MLTQWKSMSDTRWYVWNWFDYGIFYYFFCNWLLRLADLKVNKKYLPYRKFDTEFEPTSNIFEDILQSLWVF